MILVDYTKIDTYLEEHIPALLEDLSRQEWYQVPPIDPRSEAEYRTREPVQYTVYLCHRGLAFYEAASAQGAGLL